MTLKQVRDKYLDFFTSSPRNHQEIEPAPLVLEADPTTLFTSSGMQPLVPYLLGEDHPKGKRLVDSQPAIRLQDIEEVGDYSHMTFFEMLGNWSLGDYFKEDQLSWFWEFLIKELGLPKERLYISVFKGNDQVPRDDESAKIWESLGVPPKKIFFYGESENWWSRTGPPDKMPIGDIGGPDSEVFFEFPQVEHNKRFGENCGPGCDCGRFLEIGNSVFMQYKKVGEDELEELPNKNVDFGGGLIRLAASTIDSSDVFKTDIFKKIIGETEKNTGKEYAGDNIPPMRIIADHIRAATFLANNDVVPSNKVHGYILRRLIRRSAVKVRQLKGSIDEEIFNNLVEKVVESYEGLYLFKDDTAKIQQVVTDEVKKFKNTLERGLREIEKINEIDAKKAFDLYQTYGFPIEITAELFAEKGQKIDRKIFHQEFEKHKVKSRSASAGKFKGGLVDHSEETVRLHTATHLLQAALREVLGDHVIQKGQNITSKRSRFDFMHDRKLSDKEIKRLIDLINAKIDEDLPVNKEKMPLEEAEKTGAIHAFGEKYGNEVSVYFVGKDLDSAFSKEFCGGPHVDSTGQIGRVKIKKQDKIGANTVRIYLEFE